MNDVHNTSNGLTQLLNELDKEVFGAESKETASNSLVAVGSDIFLSQRNILCTDDNKSLVDHIVLDENLCETVNNNEMEIESIPLSQPFMLVTGKMYDIELDETLNKNSNTNVEIDSKATSNINDNIAKSEDSKDDDMVIDVIV